MFDNVLYIMIFCFTICIALCLYRAIKGPSTPDRIMALDVISLYLIAIIAILSVIFEHAAFLDVILLIGILSFIGTIALTRFVERGVVIVRNRHHVDRSSIDFDRDDL